MKKIFIMAHSLALGGAERSLLGILENIDYKKYSVDLFLLRREGELMQYVPSEVNILPEIPEYAALGIPIVEALKKQQFVIALDRIIGKMFAKRRNADLGFNSDSNVINEYSHKYTVKHMPIISANEYDLGISFVSPHYFVTQKIKAKRKVAWIHTDYDTMKVDASSEAKMWGCYDRIISISDNVTSSFLKTFPTLKDKMFLIENIMPVKYMEALTKAFSVETEMPQFHGINILSIGRFSPPKNFTEVPSICREICRSGVDVRWYLIGYGMQEGLIRQKIQEMQMQEHVFVLGKKENPYPYIKACDIYVQPSKYEGKSIAVREAQLLNKPVVITEYSTAHSQLIDKYDGLIVPMNVSGCAKGIVELIKDRKLQLQLIENTKTRDYVQCSEIENFFSLVEC